MSFSKLTCFGQIEPGDKLIIVDGSGKTRKATAREIQHKGTREEEVIINKSKNKYFIVSMVVNGSSWAKCVAYCSTITTA